GLARAAEPRRDDDTDATDATKAELQRRMEEARESITQTVTEIKDTVTQQYQQVKDTISDTLDWREQYRRRPLPFTAGALVGGVLLGYCVAGAFQSDDEDEDEAEDSFGRIESGFDQMQTASRSYAAAPITGAVRSRAAYQSAPPSPASADSAMGADVGPDTRPSYSSGYAAATAPSTAAEVEAEEDEPKGPGLIQRFKETKAYDRLQDELSTLGERAVEELSRTATTVVVPALLAKLKDLIGIDLSTQKQVAQRTRLEHQTAKSAADASQAAEGQTTPTENAGARGAGGAL
ncbi:MAG TPA: hypothetical protein VFS10_19585, partial [Pyrinomonadaceae bacterium]|nr:hypothetical protein [Pyrinomonadaceae bacterium]